MNKGFGLPAVFLIIATVMLLIGGTAYFVMDGGKGNNTEPIACTLEAKLCPDGSAVGRTGPNCEFAECPKEEKIPTQQPVTNNTTCGKLNDFKNEPWAPNLTILYEDWLNQIGVTGTLWPDGATMAGELSACKTENYFIFIPEFFEFGCGMIFRYDIGKGGLYTTEVAAPKSCASAFGEITDSYVEYFGNTGDGGYGKDFHGRYYFNKDRIEDF